MYKPRPGSARRAAFDRTWFYFSLSRPACTRGGRGSRFYCTGACNVRVVLNLDQRAPCVLKYTYISTHLCALSTKIRSVFGINEISRFFFTVRGSQLLIGATVVWGKQMHIFIVIRDGWMRPALACGPIFNFWRLWLLFSGGCILDTTPCESSTSTVVIIKFLFSVS